MRLQWRRFHDRWLVKPGIWCWVKARLGRRGAMLITMGWVYLFIGIGEPIRVQAHYRDAVHELIPMWIRVPLWVVPGIVCLILPWINKRHDGLGWSMLYYGPAIRVISLFGSFALGVLPLGEHGDIKAILSLPFYIALLVITMVCAGWLENPPQETCEP